MLFFWGKRRASPRRAREKKNGRGFIREESFMFNSSEQRFDGDGHLRFD